VQLPVERKHYTTSRKVAGLSTDGAIDFFFNLPDPSSYTLALGFIQPLTNMNKNKAIAVTGRGGQ
jgi:hypothetical protein